MLESNQLDIGDVVKQSGLPPSTLRFYEEKGLIQSIGRNGLRRVFSADVVEKLALITLGRNAGFSLDEIASLLTGNKAQIDRDQLRAKADDLDTTINQLIAVRDGLRHAAECPAPSHFECATFQRYMRIAVKHQQKKNTKQ